MYFLWTRAFSYITPILPSESGNCQGNIIALEFSDPSEVSKQKAIAEGIQCSITWLVVIGLFSLFQSDKFLLPSPWCWYFGRLSANCFVDCCSLCIDDVSFSLDLHHISLTGTLQMCVLFYILLCYTILVCPITGNVHSHLLNKVVFARFCNCTVSLFPFTIDDHFVR